MPPFQVEQTSEAPIENLNQNTLNCLFPHLNTTQSLQTPDQPDQAAPKDIQPGPTDQHLYAVSPKNFDGLQMHEAQQLLPTDPEYPGPGYPYSQQGGISIEVYANPSSSFSPSLASADHFPDLPTTPLDSPLYQDPFYYQDQQVISPYPSASLTRIFTSAPDQDRQPSSPLSHIPIDGNYYRFGHSAPPEGAPSSHPTWSAQGLRQDRAPQLYEGSMTKTHERRLAKYLQGMAADMAKAHEKRMAEFFQDDKADMKTFVQEVRSSPPPQSWLITAWTYPID